MVDGGAFRRRGNRAEAHGILARAAALPRGPSAAFPRRGGNAGKGGGAALAEPPSARLSSPFLAPLISILPVFCGPLLLV